MDDWIWWLGEPLTREELRQRMAEFRSKLDAAERAFGDLEPLFHDDEGDQLRQAHDDLLREGRVLLQLAEEQLRS